MDAGEFGGEGGVFGEEVGEGVAVVEEDAVRVVGGSVGVGRVGVGGCGGCCGFGFESVGWVVLFVVFVAGDGTAGRVG